MLAQTGNTPADQAGVRTHSHVFVLIWAVSCPSHIFLWKFKPLVPQNVIVFGNRDFKEARKRLLGWCFYKEGIWTPTETLGLHTCVRKDRVRGNTEKTAVCRSRGALWMTPTLLTHQYWTSGFQNYKKINPCSRHPIRGVFFWQQTSTHTLFYIKWR